MRMSKFSGVCVTEALSFIKRKPKTWWRVFYNKVLDQFGNVYFYNGKCVVMYDYEEETDKFGYITIKIEEEEFIRDFGTHYFSTD